MKTAIALIIKFIVTLAAAWISFMVFGTAAFWTVLTVAVAATVLNYLIGDLLVLPSIGNIWASIVNGAIGGAVAWATLFYAPATYAYMTTVWIFAIIIAVAEFFFHMYLISAHIVEKKKSDSDFYKKSKFNYNTETGSDLFPYGGRNVSDNGYNQVNSGYNKSTDQTGSGRDFENDSGYNSSGYGNSSYSGGGSGYSRGGSGSSNGSGGYGRSGKNNKK